MPLWFARLRSRPLAVWRARAAGLAQPPWPALLALSTLALLPVGRAAEAPVMLGAAAGVLLVARRPDALAGRGARLALALFLCYWLPVLLSGRHAVEPQRTWSTTVDVLRFLPFALFVVAALDAAAQWPRAVAACAAVVALWVVDAYVQMTTGFGLGGAAEAERLSGIFGAGNLKFGPALAVLSPFVLLGARRRFGRVGLALAGVLLTPPILLAGSRAAWLAYLVVGVLVAWREARSRRGFALALAACALGGAAVVAIALHDSARLDARVERSLLALRGTVSAVDEASAGRLSIWRTAAAMSRANALTGVGARGFRYAYPRYAAPGDRFVEPATETGASHAHQLVLEVLSETGVVGLACWIAGALLAWRAWRRADVDARERARAPMLALVAMCFPLNTHLAFYSAWW
ncbi:MAG TPA: O-antigen ligase family protein, partial [Dokdonella sp.]